MNPEYSNPEFADSAKIPEDDQAYFQNEALNSATREMITVLNKEVQKEGPVKPELVTVLRCIQAKQLYAGEPNDDGGQAFDTFEKFLRAFRRIYVRQKGRHAKERYKLVTDALLHIRLEDARFTKFPPKKSIYRKLGSVKAELQIDTWTRVLAEVVDLNVINPAKVVELAHALGDTKSKFPSPTASSEKPKLREAWKAFKADVVAEFGPSIQRHFPCLDVLVEKKGKDTPKTAASYAVLPRADVKAPDQETALGAEPTQEASTIQPAAIVMAVDVPTDSQAKAPHQFKYPDLGESVEGLNLYPRPFVTSQGGRVFIAFKSGAHLMQFTDAGMPSPAGKKRAGPYKFEPDIAEGVWGLKETLSGQALSDEVDRIAKQLETAALKMSAAGKAA